MVLEVYIGDVGALLLIDLFYLKYDEDSGQLIRTPLDVSGANIFALDVTRGNGNTERWDCVKSTESNSQIVSRTSNNQFPVKETIKISPYVEWPDGSHFHGSRITLKVLVHDGAST